MMRGIWGKKIGMTQVFSDDHKIVPVTVIDMSQWYVTNVKTQERDGYSAVQLGCVKDRYAQETFSADWIKHPKKYFAHVKEVRMDADDHGLEVGAVANTADVLGAGDVVNVTGITIGRGFQGAMKRHGFGGGRGSHGDKLGRSPGSLGGQRSSGRVFKGKKMPGHMGCQQRVMRNLAVVHVDNAENVVFVKGSIPGKAGSLVFVNKI